MHSSQTNSDRASLAAGSTVQADSPDGGFVRYAGATDARTEYADSLLRSTWQVQAEEREGAGDGPFMIAQPTTVG